MKKINNWLLLLFGVLAWTACTDEVEYNPAGPVEGEGVYFPSSMSLSNTIGSAADPEAETSKSGSLEFPVARTNGGAAATIGVEVDMDAQAAAVFDFPESVSFAEGSTETTMTVNYTNLQRGKDYNVNVRFVEGTDYGSSDVTLSFLFPAFERWEVISEEAVFEDAMFSMLLANASGPYIGAITVTVEQLEDRNKIRFRSPYTNAYFSTVFEPWVDVIPNDFNPPYIVLDGEAYTEPKEDGSLPDLRDCKFYIAPTALGFSVNTNAEMQYNEAMDYNTFGSVAYNLSTADGPLTDEDYALGSYNATREMFELGAVYHNLSGYGFYPVEEGFRLWLDPTKMSVNYDRDYTWTPVPEATGTFTSQAAGGSGIIDVEVAEEDPTLYHFVSLYAEGYNIVFNYDAEAGTVSMPSKQNTGMVNQLGGQEIYVDLAGGTVDTETMTFTFNMVFYFLDENGRKGYELARTTETFRWGYVQLPPTPEDLVPGRDISEYVGIWTAPFMNLQDGSTTELAVMISPIEGQEQYLAINGLAPLAAQNGYDDTLILQYDPESGFLMFFAQNANSFEGTEYIAVPADINQMILTTEIPLAGGITEDNRFAWFAASDPGDLDLNSILFINGSNQIFDPYVATPLVWTPYEEAANAAAQAPALNAPLKPGIKVNQVKKQWQLKAVGQPKPMTKQLQKSAAIDMSKAANFKLVEPKQD